METLFQQLADFGILPVICPPNADSSEPLADALCRGGLPVIEITLRAAWALESIRRIHASFPGMLIGAGTVYTTSQVDDAVKAGASFIVSPGLDESLVRYCQERGIYIVPGCSTPSDMTRGISLGLKTLKFFPAEISGGAAALKLYHGPFADCSFIPTGGLNMSNITPYLELPYVTACGGSFIAPKADLAAGRYDAIADLCRACCDLTIGLTYSHLVLATDSAEGALQASTALATLCHLPTPTAAQAPVRWSETPCAGLGKLIFTARSVPRALAWYRRQGITIANDTVKRDKTNTPCAFTLPTAIGGLAVEITAK